MAAGRPVLLAIDGEIRRVVEAAQAGMFIPPGDPGALAEAVRRLAAEPSLGQRMGRAGHAYVGVHFDRRSLAQKMAQVMERTLQARQKTTASSGGARDDGGP